MDEPGILSGLAGRGHQERAAALDKLRTGVKREGRLRFKAADRLFPLLADLLYEPNWNLRRDTLAFITEVVPKAGRSAGKHLMAVLPGLINNFGDSKVAIRRGAAGAIKASLEVRPPECQFAPIMVVEGIENPETRIRLEMLKCLETAAVWEATNDDDLLLLVEATAGRLRDVDSDVVEGASVVLQALPDIIGSDTLSTCIESLDDPLRELYDQLVGNSPARPSSVVSRASRSDKLAYGFISPGLLDELQSDDWEARGVAVEELEATVARLERTSSVIPHIQSLIEFLASLFTDANMKVSIGSLEVMGQLVHKVGWPMRSYLNQVMGHVIELLADTRVLLRQALTKLVSQLMQCLTPTPVLDLLLEKLDSDSWRIREEIVQIVILSLGQFPRNQFDFKRIIDALHPLLLDAKKRVKCVSVEAFTSIQQLVGDDTFDAYLKQCDVSHTVSVADELAQLRATIAQPRAAPAPFRHLADRELPGVHKLAFARSDSGNSTASVRSPRSASKLPWSSVPSTMSNESGALGSNGHDAPMGRRPRLGSTGYADRHRAKAAGSAARSGPTSPRPNDRGDSYVPSFADADASPRRERSLSASFDKRSSPFPMTAKVARSGSLRRHGSGKVREFSADIFEHGQGSPARHGESRASERSGIPGPVKRMSVQGFGGESSPGGDGASARIVAPLAMRAATPKSSTRLNRSRSMIDSSQLDAVASLDSPDSDELGHPLSTDSSRSPSRMSASPDRPASVSPSRAESEEDELGGTIPTTLTRSPGLRLDTDDDGAASPDSVFEGSDEIEDSEPLQPLRKSPVLSSAYRTPRVDLSATNTVDPTRSADGNGAPKSPKRQPASAKAPRGPSQPTKDRTVKDGSGTRRSPQMSAANDYEAELIAQAQAGGKRLQHSPSAVRRTPSTVNIGESAGLKSPARKVGPATTKPPRGGGKRRDPGVAATGEGCTDRAKISGTGADKVATSSHGKAPVRSHPPGRKPGASPRGAKQRPRGVAASPARRLGKEQRARDQHDDLRIDASAPGDAHVGAGSDDGRVTPLAPTKSQRPSPGTPAEAAPAPVTPATPTSGPRPPRHPPSSGKRSTRIRRGSGTRSTVRNATAEALLVPLASLEPFSLPQMALKDALAGLKRGVTQETWSEACEGLTIFRQLLQHNVDIVLGSLQVVTKAIANEVLCLRSITARLAILTVGDLVETVGKAADKELELVVTTLAKKIAGDGGSGFIREEIDVTMGRLRSAGVSKLKLLSALIPHHANKAIGVRAMIIKNIGELIPKTKSKILTFRDSERLLLGVTKLTEDSDPNIRYHARRTVWQLMQLDGFDQAVHTLTGRPLAKAVEVIDKLRKNGVGDPPASNKPRGISAAGRDGHASPARSTTRGGTDSRGVSARAPAARAPTAPRTANGFDRSGHGSGLKRRSRSNSLSGTVPSMGEALREDLDRLVGELAASDWKARDAALKTVEEMVDREGAKLAGGLTRLFDVFTLRLTDSNSKVNRHALETCNHILPRLAEPLAGQAPILVQLIDKLAPNLASKNKPIRDLSLGVLEMMAQTFDNVTLLQPMVNAASYGNAKVMQEMVGFIAGRVAAVFDINAKFAKRQIMPLMGRLLGDAKHKAGCSVLCQALLDCLGNDGLRDAAGLLPPDKQKLLVDVIHACA